MPGRGSWLLEGAREKALVIRGCQREGPGYWRVSKRGPWLLEGAREKALVIRGCQGEGPGY